MNGELQAAPAKPRHQRRKWLKPRSPLGRTIRILLVLGLVYFLGLPQIAGPVKALQVVGRADVPYLGLGALLEVASLACYAFFTRSLIRGPRPPLGTLARIDLSTFAVSHILPAGSIGGTGLGYKLLTSAGLEGQEAGFVIAAQSTGSAVILNLLLWVALILSIPEEGFNPLFRTAAIGGALLFASLALLIVLLIRGEGTAERFLRSVARRVPKVNEDAVAGFVVHLVGRLREVGSDPSLLLPSAGWATANWLFDAASLWVFLYAFGHTLVSPIVLLVAYGVANVLAAIPITPSGLGVIETVLPSLLVGFGTTRAIAVIAVVGWRLVNFWLPIPVGALSYLSLSVGPEATRATKMAHLNQLATRTEGRRRLGFGFDSPGQAEAGLSEYAAPGTHAWWK
ncbi:MAG: YbhN family protein [Actinomycetota bacterium]|nr:YbhN family protein [Actinomycetota bacterium]